MLIFAAVVFLAQLFVALEIFYFGRRVRPLPTASGDEALPRLSVIIPALNEGPHIRTAVESVLAQDYPDLEVILINDRSTDETGAVIDALAREHPGRVQTVHISALPPGWLGKNHALYQGVQRSSGEWLLFTDADVHFKPGALRAAVAHATGKGLDHLTLAVRIVGRDIWLRTFITYFLFAFWIGNKPYHAMDPRRPRWYVGLGAFNLVRRTAYETAGTHRAISLRPDDDMRLGLRIKRSGLRQEVAVGTEWAWVEWYPSVWEAVAGLEKNMFAFQDYSIGRITGLSILLAGLTVAPWLLLPFASGWVGAVLLATVLLQMATLLFVSGRSFTSRGEALPAALLFPLLGLMTIYVLWRSAYRTLRQGGVAWRGTLYPLAVLKSQTGTEGLAER